MRNPFARWFERRAIVFEPSDPAWFTGGITPAGVTVSPTKALTVPAVFACLQVLSQDVARTPIKLRQQTAPDTFTDALDHPLYEILNVLPNPEMTAYQFKHALQWQLLQYGKAFAEVVRIDGRIEALWPLETAYMRVDRDAQRRKRWTYTPGGQTFTWTFEASQPPILELTHETPLQRCRDVIGTALALQHYVAKFFANGAQPQGVLTVPGKLTPPQAQALREQWQARFAGTANAFRTAILDSGMEFKGVAMDHDSAQLAETLRVLTEQIAGAFRVPPWKIGDLSKANYSNMESGENAYVSSTLDPFFQSWEEAMRRDLLTARQFNTYTVTFDRQSLVRNNVQALHTSLCQGIQNGIYSQNDARRALGLNPIPDGDKYMINTALQPVGAPHVA